PELLHLSCGNIHGSCAHYVRFPSWMPDPASEMRTTLPRRNCPDKSRPAAFRTRAGPKSLNQSRSERLAFDLRNLVGSFLLGRRRLLRPAPEHILHADVLGGRVQPGFPGFSL